MTKQQMLDALRDIGLALCATHNTVTTDVVGVEPNETSWRVDHSKELEKIRLIEEIVKAGVCPMCGSRNVWF